MLTVRDLVAEYKVSYSGDEWGTCMEWWFAVAGEMYVRGLDIPDEWQYRPGISPVDEDSYSADICKDASDEALTQFGRVLNRYAAILKKAGKDY